MEIKDALTLAQAAAGWSDEQVAVVARKTSASVKRYKSGESTPPGDVVIALQKELPGFLDLLLANVAA